MDTKPNWHNRAGRVDRSACFVLTAAQIWRRVPPDHWTYRYPARQPAHRAKGKCDRFAELSFWARDLWMHHQREPPAPVQGDDRSVKSNALRPRVSEARAKPQPKPWRAQAARQKYIPDPTQGDFLRYLGQVNPNRSVGFKYYKMLGLNCLWQTTIRIERYVQHHNLKQHFLVCPVCSQAAQQRLDGQAVETRPSRRCSSATKKLPPGRVTKLYLPVCTPQEWEDAHMAELWLRTHCHPNRPWPPIAVQLIERYSELFVGQRARQLRCRQCLGLRYGEVKPKVDTSRSRRAMPRRTSSRKRTVEALLDGCQTAQPRITEQSLFLSNLRKLLAPIPDASPPPSPQRRRSAESNRVDTLPKAVKEELYRLFAGKLPAFQELEQAKQKSEHEA